MIERILSAFGFPSSMARVISALKSGPKTTSELAKATGLSRSGVVSVTMRLEVLGIVERAPKQVDGKPGRSEYIIYLKPDWREKIITIIKNKCDEVIKYVQSL